MNLATPTVQNVTTSSLVCPDCETRLSGDATICVSCGASLGLPSRASARADKSTQILEATPVARATATPWFMRKELLLAILTLGAVAIYWLTKKK